jgi:hypothetical protein
MNVRFVLPVLLLGLARSASAQTDQRAAASAEAVISIITREGSVAVAGWDRNEVSVRVRGRRAAQNVELSGGPDRIRVRAEDDEDLEVRVPRRARVDVRTQNGGINVSDLTGTVDLQSLSGSFRVSGEPRLIEIEGVSGSINILGRTTKVHANTVSGEINLARASGEVTASTTSGSITVVAEDLRSGNFSSTSGEVLFEGRPARDAALYFDSASGVLELRLPESFAADYEISTVTGEVDNEFGPRPMRNRYTNGQSLRFATGSGARIRAASVSGRVILAKPRMER